MTTEHITPANTNIFEDLGLPDAENLKIRAQLMMAIRKFVNDSGMTQAKAAKALKTTQPRLNEVLHGRIDKCTIDRLVQMLSEVGMHVNITITTDRAA
ncbi:MAG: helix-turn-helix domain-containing protein [Candidatus Thiodiazotropha sp. (ex Dulcina madagascariensis)]|nr:helix-turn-helix domain-containing protein [Candidatus Thiodiazotropha sp. (ex Epidulcina cf. delphinae)]MCU7921667.1 helix-turn-helix domain-containing protein [Candidatus Thiodiazotropha sp. (ex Dulcina madagascariensis)]MCU7928833.1 helix-turn-helix domain-containing protein [Candidatus Thiodiazotropha sp. (ex Dulcina madagascariensis)]